MIQRWSCAVYEVKGVTWHSTFKYLLGENCVIERRGYTGKNLRFQVGITLVNMWNNNPMLAYYWLF